MEVTAARTRRPLLEAPDTVLLGHTARPLISDYSEPADVRGPGDLPPRFYFGDLDHESFEVSGGGWTAHFGNPERTGLRLSWDGHRLTVDAVFEEARVSTVGPSIDLVNRNVLSGSIDLFAPGLGRVAERHGALVARPPNGAFYFAGFPDGPLATLLVPIHPLRLAAAVDWFQDDVAKADVTAFAAGIRIFDQTYYAAGAATDVPRDVLLAPQQALQEGALAAETTLVTGRDGSDLRIDRVLFVLEIHAPYRDLDFLLASLAQSELARGPSPPPEWRPVIVPTVVACKDQRRIIRTADDDDREVTAILPPSRWMQQLSEAHPVLRDAAHQVAVSIQLAWMKEVHLLEREAPDLARVASPEPPFRWIAF